MPNNDGEQPPVGGFPVQAPTAGAAQAEREAVVVERVEKNKKETTALVFGSEEYAAISRQAVFAALLFSTYTLFSA